MILTPRMRGSEMLAKIGQDRRAWRRHHRGRMIAHARRVVGILGIGDVLGIDWSVKNHDHLKVCSCWMCCNPRKTEGRPSIQERRRLWDEGRGGLSGGDS